MIVTIPAIVQDGISATKFYTKVVVYDQDSEPVTAADSYDDLLPRHTDLRLNFAGFVSLSLDPSIIFLRMTMKRPRSTKRLHQVSSVRAHGPLTMSPGRVGQAGDRLHKIVEEISAGNIQSQPFKKLAKRPRQIQTQFCVPGPRN